PSGRPSFPGGLPSTAGAPSGATWFLRSRTERGKVPLGVEPHVAGRTERLEVGPAAQELRVGFRDFDLLEVEGVLDSDDMMRAAVGERDGLEDAQDRLAVVLERHRDLERV